MPNYLLNQSASQNQLFQPLLVPPLAPLPVLLP
jgi:hypothetical protein